MFLFIICAWLSTWIFFSLIAKEIDKTPYISYNANPYNSIINIRKKNDLIHNNGYKNIFNLKHITYNISPYNF